MPIRVLCVLYVLILCSFPLARAEAQPTCKDAYGVTVCGYDCVAQFGQVRCAQTPQGACGYGYGKVQCWDPHPDVVDWLNYQRSNEQAQCMAAFGQLACGFNCQSGYGQVQCSQTPGGICIAAYGHVRCWSPKLEVLWNMANSGQIVEPECKTANGQVACGYHCIFASGKVRCAQSPEGSCLVQHDQVMCWDPPLRADEPRGWRRHRSR